MNFDDPPGVDLIDHVPSTPPDHSPRRGLLKLLVFFSLILIVFAAGALYVRTAVAGSSGPSQPVTITIPEGSSVSKIAALLEREHIIRNAWLFRFVAAFDGRASKLKAGQYHLQTGMSFSAVLGALAHGPVIVEQRFTVPEGKTVQEVIDIVGSKTTLSAARFRAEVTSGKHRLPIMPAGVTTLEGLLFPKTYVVREEMSEADVVEMMLEQFTIETTSMDFTKAPAKLKPYQVIIVASLIEREAKVSGDRAKIARVIYNRIARGMRLQIDATVQYAIFAKTGQYKPRLSYGDLKINSPYNTYAIAGLPPTPIANPGAASIEAALNPATTDALFYVLCDKNGSHAFAKTAPEFENLKRTCAARQ